MNRIHNVIFIGNNISLHYKHIVTDIVSHIVSKLTKYKISITMRGNHISQYLKLLLYRKIFCFKGFNYS